MPFSKFYRANELATKLLQAIASKRDEVRLDTLRWLGIACRNFVASSLVSACNSYCLHALE